MKTAALITFAALIASTPASAATREPEQSPQVTIHGLPCAGACAASTPPKPIDHDKPMWPGQEAYRLDGYTEALVTVAYTIGADGQVRDANIETLLGPQAFADAAVEAVKAWTFKPATIAGKPVETSASVEFVFRFVDVVPGAGDAIANRYRQAMALARDGKLDEGLAILKAAQASIRLNFYERTILAYATALVLHTQKNDTAALGWMRLAMIRNGAYIDRRFKEEALKFEFILNAKAGEYAAALNAADTLEKTGYHATAVSLAEVAADIHASIAGTEPIWVSASIPYPEQGGRRWIHTLVRRTFAFSHIEGQLDRFQLSCDQQAIESPITTTAEWHVPANWSGCEVSVSGPPGTKFQLVELN